MSQFIISSIKSSPRTIQLCQYHKNNINCLTAFSLYETTRVSWYQNSQEHWPNMPPSLSSNSSQALPTFPPRPPITLLVSQENTGDRLTKHEEPKDKKLHFLYVLLIPLVPSHSITTSWPAAATEMRARVCNPRYFYVGCLSCHNFLYVRAQRQAQNMLACIPWG